jgi:hypothetical protein
MFLASPRWMFESINPKDASRILAREIREKFGSRQSGENRIKEKWLAVVDDLAM